jgi:site-specific DNA-methyltransferase (adenine-specific)
MSTSTGSPGANQGGITNWPTPQWLVDQLAEEFAPGGFDLDPAATAENAKALRFFTESVDGLAQPWHARAVWCNPPYGKTSTPRWLAKAKAEVDAGHAGLVVCLVPARVGTTWWKQYAVDRGVFIRQLGRIRWHLDRRGEAPFDSAVIIFGRISGRHGRWPSTCANPACARRFWPARSDAKTCSSACRQALRRRHSNAHKRDTNPQEGIPQ